MQSLMHQFQVLTKRASRLARISDSIKERIDDALAVFELNVEMFPEAWNPWDSLGEANMKRGNLDRAIECYEKSLALNPENTGGAEILKQRRERKVNGGDS